MKKKPAPPAPPVPQHDTIEIPLADGRTLIIYHDTGLYRWSAKVDGVILNWGDATPESCEKRALHRLGLHERPR